MFNNKRLSSNPDSATNRIPSPVQPTSEPTQWYELTGPGVRIRYTEEINGQREIISESNQGGSASQSRARLGGGNFSSVSGAIKIEGRGDELYVNDQRVDLSQGRPLPAEPSSPASAAGAEFDTTPVHADETSSFTMAPMRPMRPMQPMQPMNLSSPGMNMSMGNQGMSMTMNGRTMTLPRTGRR